jgi:hypothetical protein
MLFYAAIDPLQNILEVATRDGVLLPIKARNTTFKASLYADDAGIFASPCKAELDAVSAILDFFRKASGLITNLGKTEVFPIRCDNINLPDILSEFPTRIVGFLGSYLGLPFTSNAFVRFTFSPTSTRLLASSRDGFVKISPNRAG